MACSSWHIQLKLARFFVRDSPLVQPILAIMHPWLAGPLPEWEGSALRKLDLESNMMTGEPAVLECLGCLSCCSCANP